MEESANDTTMRASTSMSSALTTDRTQSTRQRESDELGKHTVSACCVPAKTADGRKIGVIHQGTGYRVFREIDIWLRRLFFAPVVARVLRTTGEDEFSRALRPTQTRLCHNLSSRYGVERVGQAKVISYRTPFLTRDVSSNLYLTARTARHGVPNSVIAYLGSDDAGSAG